MLWSKVKSLREENHFPCCVLMCCIPVYLGNLLHAWKTAPVTTVLYNICVVSIARGLAVNQCYQSWQVIFFP